MIAIASAGYVWAIISQDSLQAGYRIHGFGVVSFVEHLEQQYSRLGKVGSYHCSHVAGDFVSGSVGGIAGQKLFLLFSVESADKSQTVQARPKH